MENWTHWKPTTNVSGRFIIISLILTYDDLTIELSAEDNDTKIKIIFHGNIDAYRCTNESFCSLIFNDLSKKYGDAFYSNWSFFQITNSEYAKSLSEKSGGWSDEFTFRHFCIIGDDEVVDILARYEPEIKVLHATQNLKHHE